LAETYEGPARIVDGDTLYVQQQKFRLYAIDAPEKAQMCSTLKGQDYPCGQVSLTALQEHVGNNPVRCETKNKDQYGRNVGVCYLVQGKQTEDLNGWLVSNGLAVAYR
jgi:endonuclease YncB( thermonuclease family)